MRGVIVASPDFSDGCMIALYPPPDVAEALAVDVGLPPDEMHVTVAYLGDASDIDGDVLRKVVAELAERQPFTAQISGHARFTGGDKDVIVALIDSADLEDLRRDTLDALYERGIEIPREHGFTAHCTITYLDPGDPSPYDRLGAQRIEFAALSAVHGTDRTDTAFAVPRHPIETLARESFASGWAASGGPMPERVKAACTAAVRVAAEHPDDPGILEVAVDLGRLEGVWARLFQRRQQLIAQHTAAVRAAWRALITPRLLRDGIYHLRAELGLREADDRDNKAVKAAAMAAAVDMLQALPDQPGYGQLRRAIRDALAAGRAEGMVGAVAIAAQQARRDGLDWDTAFDDAYRQLDRLADLWSQADEWAARLAARAAADLGRVLARSAQDDASYDDMAAQALDALDGQDDGEGGDDGAPDAVGFTTDWAMTTAAAAGALYLYQLAGAIQITWVSVGDGKVCVTCEANESGSPYTPDTVPPLPAHPLCRCFLSAQIDLGSFADWFT